MLVDKLVPWFFRLAPRLTSDESVDDKDIAFIYVYEKEKVVFYSEERQFIHVKMVLSGINRRFE